ncbi:RNB domain-containing ribonuclease [Arthrobacter sp. H14]|uniref:RNB domain-containing ribonuclease n=1 Tax=Arthrobacter sp. H14 TaxID=1312959 RepID=UPI0004B7010F|nr:RNB domain-containing ribonuclease [Arthrobacter sp. H14]
MPYSHIDLTSAADKTRGAAQDELAWSLADLRVELELPADFSDEVLKQAKEAVNAHTMPEPDYTELPFVTIDPPGSTDLDQAVLIERAGSGYRVYYAIADVPAFVRPGSALDVETRRRGQTIYAPDSRIPLHPEVIGEDAASLLPNQIRPAYVWEFDLDGEGRLTASALQRARIQSTAQLTYEEVQKDIDAGTAPESFNLLKEVGKARIALERARGGASLALPEQEVEHDGRRYLINARPPFEVENWNAQISLLTGMAAAELMLHGNVGILRTMPPPQADAVSEYRQQTKALGNPWPEDIPYGEYLRSLDTSDPKQLALMFAAASLFRGAGYTPFDGAAPPESVQAAVAAPYAHATAPLRRLVDRFVLPICEAIANNKKIPEWARQALPELPSLMASSDQLTSRVERESLNAVEAAVMSSFVGDVFDAVVISTRNGTSGTIQIKEPPVTARCEGKLTTGTTIRAELVSADIAKREVLFKTVDVG